MLADIPVEDHTDYSGQTTGLARSCSSCTFRQKMILGFTKIFLKFQPAVADISIKEFY
jgi:hypothetical protein